MGSGNIFLLKNHRFTDSSCDSQSLKTLTRHSVYMEMNTRKGNINIHTYTYTFPDDFNSEWEYSPLKHYRTLRKKRFVVVLENGCGGMCWNVCAFLLFFIYQLRMSKQRKDLREYLFVVASECISVDWRHILTLPMRFVSLLPSYLYYYYICMHMYRIHRKILWLSIKSQSTE